MFLKSLELHGFKSFADNTLFEFHDGVTGIVGPNGCGKSNVVDAIRWVLGESSAKALRGSEMADVIFNGTESRKALGLAEVTLTLSRCESVLGTDYHEVAIGRRVFRDGNSDYLLNGTVVRRKDIQNLLMDTGIGRTSYSIMEQGKIDMLLSSKPEDRRAVFEEAAGITKFKVQKKEALRKLDYTEANLVRVADIIAEVKRQMNSLQRQAAKARRFQSLLNDVKVLDTHFSHRQFQELQAEKAELETSISSLRKEQSELEEKIDRQQTRIGETRDHYQHLESEIGDTRQQIADQQARIQAATGRVNFNEERSRELKSLIDQNATDIQSTGSKLEQQELDLRSTDETLSEIEAKLQSQRHQLETAVSDNHQQREHLETLQQELDNTQQEGTRSESDLISIKAQLENLLAQSEADRTRRDQLTEELDLLRREHGSKREEFNRLQTGINEYQKTIEDSEQQLIIADKAAEAARRKLDDMRDHLRDIHRSLTQKQSRLQIIRQLIDQGEGFQKGTQAVMRHFDEPERFGHAVRGVLASFVEAEPDYAAAIEAALGRHLQTVLVSNSGAAEQIIDTLSERKLGEASLIVEEFIGAATHDLPRALPEGAVAWALDKTRVHQNFRGIVQKLLVNVLIVPNIRVALNLRNQLDPATSFATLNGELVSPLGIIEGGAGTEDKGAVLQRQSEVRQLESETTELQKEVTSHEEQVEALEMKLMHHEGNLEVDRERLQHTRLVHSTLDGKKNLLGREIQTLETKIESLEWEQAEVEKRAEASDANMSGLHEQQDAAALNLEQTRARINQLTDELKNTEKLAHESAAQVNDLRTALAVEQRTHENLREQREPMTSRMRELNDIIERRRKEIEAYHDRIASSAEENERLGKESEAAREVTTELEQQMQQLGEQRSDRAAAIETAEAELIELRRTLSANQEQRGNEEIKTTQLDLRIENVRTTILQRYQIHLENFEPDPHALLAAIETQKKARSSAEKRRATRAAKEAAQEDGTDDQDHPETEDPLPEAESETESPAQEPETEPAPVATDGEPDWTFVESVVNELKQKLDSMGPVNIEAIEEFEELEERHTFLDGQHKDLVEGREELLRVISKINRETRKKFAETFATIRTNFQDMFSELFGKGAKADLVLMDESDPLECGIEIIAKPPGKKLQSISLLSGGERSMTAVALLFAIYMVKPSPFCVLDELDAPLDEANIERFLRVLDRFIGQSQFVIVTHSKRTMSRADIMYGVTMEEYGVSKRIGMKLTGEDHKPNPTLASPEKSKA